MSRDNQSDEYDEAEQKFSPQKANQQFRESVDLMRKTFEQQVEYYGENSKLLKARYDALIVAGFTDAQAITIVVNRALT